MSTRARVALVTEHWGDLESEPATIARLLAGALSRSAAVEVLHTAAKGAGPATSRDSVFVLHELPQRAGHRLRADLLRVALSSTSRHLSPAFEHLVESEAGHTEGVGARLDAITPDAVVLVGHEQRWDHRALRSGGPPVVFVPILSDLGRVKGSVISDLVGRSSRIATVNPGEHAAFLAAYPERAPDIVALDPALPLNRSATSQLLFGVHWFGTYVLLLRAFPPGTHRYARVVTRELLTSLLGVSVAEIDGERFTVSDQENTVELPVNPTRVNLWRLMAHAKVTIDARPPGPFGQETIESLLLGTPVVVPAGSAAAAIASTSGGGLSYAEPGDLVDAARRLLEPGASEAAGAAGRTWAERTHSDAARFVRRAAEIVLGTTPQLLGASSSATSPSRMSDSE